MPRKRPAFVELWRDRHGKVRVYFRKDRGPRLPLPNTIGSDEFHAAYEAAMARQVALPQALTPRLISREAAGTRTPVFAVRGCVPAKPPSSNHWL
jgi:hypothetical protein